MAQLQVSEPIIKQLIVASPSYRSERKRNGKIWFGVMGRGGRIQRNNTGFHIQSEGKWQLVIILRKNSMKNLHLKHLLLLLALLTTSLAQNNTNATTPNFAPPPGITSQIVVRLNASTVGSRFIGSKRIENMQISHVTVNATGVTKFKFNFFNRTATDNLNIYEFTEEGTWSYLGGSKETLSCNLVFEENRKIFGLLQFSNDKGKVDMIAKAPLSLFDTTIQAMVNMNVTEFANGINLGENCNAGLFTTPSGSVLYRLNDNRTDLNAITLPAGFNSLSITESMVYGVFQGKIYKYNPTTSDYSVVFNVKVGQGYTIKQVRERILVTSYNITNPANESDPNRIYQIYETAYFLKDENTATLRQLGSMDFVSLQPWSGNVELFPSPQLTKVGFSYYVSNNTQRIVVKSIDYTRNTVTDLTFQDPAHALTTIKGIDGINNFDFSDYFLIFRNSSLTRGVPGGTPFEEAYQFVGGQIIFMRGRELSGRELTDFKKIFVDNYFTNKLIVLDSYNVTGGYEVEEFDYGSLSSMTKIIPAVTPPLSTFTIPHSATDIPIDKFAWVFKETITGDTKFTAVRPNRNAPNNIEKSELTIAGTWNVLVQNERCKLLGYGATISVFKMVPNVTTLNKIADVQAAIASQNITLSGATKWAISDKCDRFSVDSTIFTQSPNNQSEYRPIMNNFATLVWTAADSNLTNLIKGNEMWRLSPASNNYTRYYASTNSTPLHADTKLYVFRNRIVITSTEGNTGTTRLLALNDDNNGNLQPCVDLNVNFNSAPKFWVSSNLTKVMVMGPFTPNTTGATAGNRVDAFFVDYDRLTNRTIDFPREAIKDPLNTIIQLEEKFLYLRQINGAPTADNPNQEIIYYLDQDTVAKVASKVNITGAMATAWKKSTLEISPEGKFYSLTASMTTDNTDDTYTIKQTEVSAEQANFNSNTQPGVTGYMVNGAIKLCTPGCNDCSSGQCTSCLTGYTFDSTTATCFTCALNCIACSAADPNLCTACITGSYLSGSSCLPCNRTCVACTTNANTCTTCPPGQYFDGSQCSFCFKNCQTCTSATVCTLCNRGFALDTVLGVTKCRGCSVKCSSCNPANITECTSCAAGLQLVSGSCVQCPDKCTSCSDGKCAVCISGFTPNSNGVCVKTCQLPCATCVDNQPSVCLSCYSGSALAGSTCQIDVNCTASKTCTDCGQGLGYILVAAQCLPCTQLSNCLQCSATNADVCSICAQGYFVGTTGCQSCPTECITCVSSTACTACALGYTLAESQTQGQCLACESPCATCISSTTYCSSCVSGFTKKGWKCQNNTYVGFKITLQQTESNVLSGLDALITALLTLVNENVANTHTITFETITTGSTSLTGSYTPTSPTTLSASASSLSGLTTGSTFGTFTVLSSSASTVDLNSQEATEEKKVNIGLIVGLAVGIPALLTVGIVIGYFVWKKSRATAQIISASHAHNPVMEVPQNILIEDKSVFEVEIRQPSNPNVDQFSSNIWEKQNIN